MVRSRAQTTFSRCSQIFRWYNSIWSNFLGHGCTLLRPEEISSNCGVQVVQKSSGILTKKKTCWPSPCAERAGVSNLVLTNYLYGLQVATLYYLSRLRYRARHNKIRGQSVSLLIILCKLSTKGLWYLMLEINLKALSALWKDPKNVFRF